MKVILIVLLLVGVALCGDQNRSIIVNCTNCSSTNDTSELCFYFDGGPFDKYELPLSQTRYSSCISPYISFNRRAINFTCDTDKKCNNSCLVSSSNTIGFDCSNKSLITKNLNEFYSYMIGDPTLESQYDWCEGVCAGFPLWLIIVIAVAAVILIIGVGIGIWWWRKKHGGKLPNFDTDAAEKLVK